MTVALRQALEFFNDKHPNEKMTKTRLAEIVGVSRKTISTIGSGKSDASVEIAI